MHEGFRLAGCKLGGGGGVAILNGGGAGELR
jgi:hypothetical protein